jgi:cyclopentanol dehydrogenase
MQRLKDKVALITGAARGMGETDARLFASEGASLILTDVDKENLEKLAEEIKSQGTEVLALVQDVASEEDWKKVAAEAEKTFGRVDILVNNAGIVRMEGIEAATKEQWDKIIAVNQTGAWLGMKYTLPLMRQAGGGSIVNINSVYGLIGSGTSVAYHASKGGMRVLSKTAAMEFAKDNIRVNTIFPGGIDTGIDTGQSDEETKAMIEQFLKLIPMGRMGKPIEIANAVLFLASDESSYITGAELVIDGGWTIS